MFFESLQAIFIGKNQYKTSTKPVQKYVWIEILIIVYFFAC